MRPHGCGGTDITKRRRRKMPDKKTLSNLYHAGMAFAAQLRLVGEHEAAHDIEVYVLDIKKELENASTEE